MDAVIFDKDGTLFDFRKSWVDWVRLILAELADGPDHTARLAGAIGFDSETGAFHPESPVISATAEDIALALLPELPDFGQEALVLRLNQSAVMAPMVPAVPLRPVLEGLRKRDLKIGLATNDAEAPARTHLRTHGIEDLFDFIAGYDSGHGAKPGPGMCLAFAKAVGIPPSRTVMVGDSRHDLQAGRAAGMATAGVLTGLAGEEALADLADIVLPDISGLAGWIDSLPPCG
ncbi:MAG: HAD family hydrolase [Pseudorhodobacter sp.]